jgi:hypothetical protein
VCSSTERELDGAFDRFIRGAARVGADLRSIQRGHVDVRKIDDVDHVLIARRIHRTFDDPNR